MKRAEVIRNLCRIVSRVGNEVFEHKVEADCFCSEGRLADDPTFSVADDVIGFVESAVNNAICVTAIPDDELDSIVRETICNFFNTNPSESISIETRHKMADAVIAAIEKALGEDEEEDSGPGEN